MSRSPAPDQNSTVVLPMISQHLPLLSRAGLSKPTHTHRQRTPPHHQAAIVAVLISGAASSRPSSRAKRGNCAGQALVHGLGAGVGQRQQQ